MVKSTETKNEITQCSSVETEPNIEPPNHNLVSVVVSTNKAKEAISSASVSEQKTTEVNEKDIEESISNGSSVDPVVVKATEPTSNQTKDERI